MDRLNGYIDLDLLLKENFEELKNKGIIQELAQFFELYKININQKSYFFKKCNYQESVTELIVNQMLNYAKIPNIKYDLACINGAYGVISKNFKKNGYKYIEGYEILQEYKESLKKQISKTKDKEYGKVLADDYEMFFNTSGNIFEIIWHALEYHYRDFKNKQEIVFKIMQQLSITHIKDLLILNQDRHSANWIIEENKDDANLVIDFDHGLAFRDFETNDLRINPLGESSLSSNNYEELEKFIKWSDKSIYNLITDLRSKLGMENLKKAIKAVEKKIGVPIREDVKKDIITKFSEHIKKVDKILASKNEKEIEHLDLDVNDDYLR